LIDRQVVDEFNELSEHNRMTRGLIDWLGFRRTAVHFKASDRLHGEAGYSFWKLVKLASESFIAHSLFPLRLAGYLGLLVLPLSGLLGIVMLADRYIIDLGLRFSGPAMLANIILFLVGVILISLGLLSYYIGHIFEETQNRPLYVVKKNKNDNKSEEN
jgi:dolichol-phosphate mannosyltransferase